MADKEEKKSKSSKVKVEKEAEDKKAGEDVKESENLTPDVEEGGEKKKDVEGEHEESSVPQEESLEEDQEDDTRNDRFAHTTVYADDASAITIEKRFSFKRLLLFISIVCFSAAAFFGAMLYYQKNSGNMNVNLDFNFNSLLSFIQPSPTPTETPMPTPTPEPEITLSDYSLQVLNGSGVSGAAGTVRDFLEEEGFEDVEVGNADDQNFDDTEVRMKESVPSEVFDIIAKALPEYTVIEGDELDEDDEYDIIVTVGQKAEEE